MLGVARYGLELAAKGDRVPENNRGDGAVRARDGPPGARSRGFVPYDRGGRSAEVGPTNPLVSTGGGT